MKVLLALLLLSWLPRCVLLQKLAALQDGSSRQQHKAHRGATAAPSCSPHSKAQPLLAVMDYNDGTDSVGTSMSIQKLCTSGMGLSPGRPSVLLLPYVGFVTDTYRLQYLQGSDCE